jgi:amino acid transporter
MPGLPYRSPFQPYMSWATLVALAIVTLFSGYAVFLNGHWNTSSFLVSYIGIPIFFSKLNDSTRLVPPKK